jgi:hypothetical protein
MQLKTTCHISRSIRLYIAYENLQYFESAEIVISVLNIQFSICIDFKHTSIHTKALKETITLPGRQIIA